MNRFVRAAAASVLAMGLSTAVMAQSALNSILDDGVLRVGTTGDWNPMSVREKLTTADLSAYDGQLATIRWRLACDTSVSDGDWLIDDISINNVGIGGPCDTIPADGLIFFDGFESKDASRWVVVTN